jgi:hypothetical protein
MEKGTEPLSDLKCKDGDGHNVYLSEKAISPWNPLIWDTFVRGVQELPFRRCACLNFAFQFVNPI